MFCCCTWGAPCHLLSLLSESYLLVVTGKVELTGCSRELTRWRLSQMLTPSVLIQTAQSNGLTVTHFNCCFIISVNGPFRTWNRLALLTDTMKYDYDVKIL